MSVKFFFLKLFPQELTIFPHHYLLQKFSHNRYPFVFSLFHIGSFIYFYIMILYILFNIK